MKTIKPDTKVLAFDVDADLHLRLKRLAAHRGLRALLEPDLRKIAEREEKKENRG